MIQLHDKHGVVFSKNSAFYRRRRNHWKEILVQVQTLKIRSLHKEMTYLKTICETMNTKLNIWALCPYPYITQIIRDSLNLKEGATLLYIIWGVVYCKNCNLISPGNRSKFFVKFLLHYSWLVWLSRYTTVVCYDFYKWMNISMKKFVYEIIVSQKHTPTNKKGLSKKPWRYF